MEALLKSYLWDVALNEAHLAMSEDELGVIASCYGQMDVLRINL